MALTVRSLADRLGAEVRGDETRELFGAAALEQAGPRELSFAADEPRLQCLGAVRAGAVLVPAQAAAASLPQTLATLLFVDDPRLAFARALRLLAADAGPPAPGVDARAHVAASATVAASARVHAFAHIGERAQIGERVVLFPGVVLGDDAVLGDDCVLHPHVTVYARSRLGARVLVHAGAVIGSDGYGFVRDGAAYLKVEQLGVVVLEDDVEVGAGCTIDRAALGETRIGRGSKLDNLVHVGHNVRIGENCLLVAQVGIAGSTELGDEVVLGGQVGVGGHLKVASGVRVGGQGGVAKSLGSPGDYWGTPARPHGEWLRMLASLSRVSALGEKLRALAARVESLEKKP